jgi:large subunit ribosomal protein L31
MLEWVFRFQRKEHAVKEGIHPKYHMVEARCACGATWKTRSTKPELHLEICSNCHPFFTGRQNGKDYQGSEKDDCCRSVTFKSEVRSQKYEVRSTWRRTF